MFGTAPEMTEELRQQGEAAALFGPLLGQAARSSGREGLLLRCLHLGSLLIHLLRSLRPLLEKLGLRGLSCRPLLLLLHCRLSLRGQESLLLGCPLLPNCLVLRCLHLGSLLVYLLHGLGLRGLSCRPLLLLLRSGLSLGRLDCGLLLLKLLPSSGSGLCFVLVSEQIVSLPNPVAIRAVVSVIPVAIPIFAASPIAASTDGYIGFVGARAKVTRRIAISWVDRRGSFCAAVRIIACRDARRLLGAAEKHSC